MSHKVAGVALLLSLMAGCGGGADAPETAGTEGVTVLTGARLIDGTGGQPIENAVIVIRGDRIESVGEAASVTPPEGAEVIDVTGKTIMPGIINLHGHLALTEGLENAADNFNEQNIEQKLRQWAQYGILHVVSMGTDKPLIWDVRARQRAGEAFLPGARIYTAGRGFGVLTGYPPVQPGTEGGDTLDVNRLSSPEEAEAAVAELATHEPDFVKLWVDHHFNTLPPFAPEIFQAIVADAKERGLRPVAHIHTLADAHALIDAGVVGLIHSVRDAPVDQALIDKMLSGNIFQVATLVREESMFIYANQRAPYLDDPFFTEHMPAAVVDSLESQEFQAAAGGLVDLEEWEPALRTAQQNLKTLSDAGVRIGFGSDSGPRARFEGYFEHREMELMAEAGLTPAQIIQAATSTSAEILGIAQDYGTIEAGKKAEFLVLGANPLENISNTKTLEEVWQDGQRIFDLR